MRRQTVSQIIQSSESLLESAAALALAAPLTQTHTHRLPITVEEPRE